MAWTHNEETGIYRVAFSELDELLKSLPENTVDTPYELDVYGLTDVEMSGASAPVEGTIQYILQQNSTKYVYLNESEGCVTAYNATYSFGGCKNLVKVSGDFTSIVDSSNLFLGCTNLRYFDADFSKLRYAGYMFRGCSNLMDVNTLLITPNQAGYMFDGCKSLVSIDASKFQSITTSIHMFSGCSSLTTILNPRFDNTNYTTLMFEDCISLETINTIHFEEVINAGYMFSGCKNLRSIDKWGFNFDNLKKFNGMFSGCDSFENVVLDGTVISNPYDNSDFAPSSVTSLKSKIKDFFLDNFSMTVNVEGFGVSFTSPLKVNIEYLNHLLEQLPENSVDEPYELNITNLTKESIEGGDSYASDINTIRGCLLLNPKKYVDLESTVYPSVDFNGTPYLRFLDNLIVSPDLSRLGKSDALGLFRGCSNLKKVTSLSPYMKRLGQYSISTGYPGGCFEDCTNLVEIPALSGDFNDISDAFANCSSLKIIDLSGMFHLSNKSRDTFVKCSSLETLYIGLEDVLYTSGSFRECVNITDVYTRIHYGNYSGELVSRISSDTKKTDINYHFELTGLTRVMFSKLDELLKGLPENTVDTPYELDIYELDNDSIKSISDTLKANQTKYISLSESDDSITATDAASAFSDCYSLISVAGNFSSVTNALSMFNGCSSLRDINNALFSNVTDAVYMFYNCSLEVMNNDTFVSVITSRYMFATCKKLTEANASSFKSVTVAEFMFSGCSLLESIKDPNFSAIKNVRNMFHSCSSLLSIDTSSFSQVSNSEYMFYDCEKLYEINKWGFNLNILSQSSDMFYGCSSLSNVYVDIVIPNEYDNSTINGSNINTFIKNKGKGTDTNIIIAQTYTAPLKTKFSYLDNLLTQLKDNTKETPYILDVYEIDSNIANGSSDPQTDPIEGSIQNVLYNHLGKFVSLEESEGSFNTYSSANCFKGCTNLIDVSGDFSTTEVTTGMFAMCSNLKSVDAEFTSARATPGMFSMCTSLHEISCNNFPKTENAELMFNGCSSLQIVDLNGLIKVKNASEILARCSNLISVSMNDICATLTNFSSAFMGDSKLETVHGFNINPNNVLADDIFVGCNSLTNVYSDNVLTYTVGGYHAYEFQIPENAKKGDEIIVNVYSVTGDVKEVKITLQDESGVLIPSVEDSKLDELIFTTEALDQETIKNMMTSRMFITTKDCQNPYSNEFVLWAKDAGSVNTNIVSITDDELNSIFD